jgi:hypothetical protein
VLPACGCSLKKRSETPAIRDRPPGVTDLKKKASALVQRCLPVGCSLKERSEALAIRGRSPGVTDLKKQASALVQRCLSVVVVA